MGLAGGCRGESERALWTVVARALKEGEGRCLGWGAGWFLVGYDEGVLEDGDVREGRWGDIKKGGEFVGGIY